MTHPLRATAHKLVLEFEAYQRGQQTYPVSTALENLVEAALADVQRATILKDAKWMQHTAYCRQCNEPHSDGEADFRSDRYVCIPSCGLTARLTEGT